MRRMIVDKVVIFQMGVLFGGGVEIRYIYSLIFVDIIEIFYDGRRGVPAAHPID